MYSGEFYMEGDKLIVPKGVINQLQSCPFFNLSKIYFIIIIIIIIIIIKKGWHCKAEKESDIHSISPKNPAQQCQPINKK